MDESPKPKKGAIVASYMGSLTLRDPDPDDVSRANRPLVPGAPTVQAIEDAIAEKMAELGFAASVSLTDTRN